MRSAMIYVPATVGMTLKLTNALSRGGGDPELLFVHGDAASQMASRPARPLQTNSPLVRLIGVRTMIYSACGVNATMALTMAGQLYLGNDGLKDANDGLKLNNGSTFDCASMGWPEHSRTSPVESRAPMASTLRARRPR